MGLKSNYPHTVGIWGDLLGTLHRHAFSQSVKIKINFPGELSRNPYPNCIFGDRIDKGCATVNKDLALDLTKIDESRQLN